MFETLIYAAREELFITTKVSSGENETLQLFPAFHAAEDVEKSVNFQLKQLQLDYFDLYLIHIPVSFKVVSYAHTSLLLLS